jgi:hypothetical protein
MTEFYIIADRCQTELGSVFPKHPPAICGRRCAERGYSPQVSLR